MYTRLEKSQILNLLRSPQWVSIENIAQEVQKEIQDDAVSHETEWDTIKSALLKQGQVNGIKRFIQRLYDIAQSDET